MPEQRVEDALLARFWASVIKYLDESSGSREGIHVTDLLYDCLRRAWYGKRVGEPISDPQGVLAVLVGQKLHEIAVCDEHEVAVEHVTSRGTRVVGRVDEICTVGGETVVLDKKTTRQLPSKPHEHHVRQVTFYAAVLHRAGRRVDRVAVLYVDVANLQTRLFVLPVTPVGLEQALAELETLADGLAAALASDTPPPRRMGWWCDYCSLFRRCMTEQG
ncbi:MAG: PD-(D/E)XK nuclease family protein [Thermofilaceae archaeon]